DSEGRTLSAASYRVKMREVPIPRGFLAFSMVGSKAVAVGNGLGYFISVFNGSEGLVVAGRDTRATWRSTKDLGWSKARVLQELRSGRPYRTSPRGIDIDWGDPWVDAGGLDVRTSEVRIVRGQRRATPPIYEANLQYVGLEIWDGEATPSATAPANAPVASPA